MGYTTHRSNPNLALVKRARFGLVAVEGTKFTAQPEQLTSNEPDHSNFLFFVKRAQSTSEKDGAVLSIHRLLHEVFPTWGESRVQVMSELMYDNLQARDKAWLHDSLEHESSETTLEDLGLGDLPDGFDEGDEAKW